MIRFPLYPEPDDFQHRVRSRGRIYLAARPHPTNAQWRNHEYWMEAHDPLYALYGGICVYCASWTARRGNSRLEDNTSVDHFLPKSLCPGLAYEWNNLRMCRTQLNRRKKQFLDVMDPLAINSDWFQLNFYNFHIEPNPNAMEMVRSRVVDTTARLELNDEGYIRERIEVLKQHFIQGYPLENIEVKYPFIAREIRRIAHDAKIREDFVNAFS